MADVTRLPVDRNGDGERTMARSSRPNTSPTSPLTPTSPLSPERLLEAWFFIEETFLMLELVTQDGEKKDQPQADALSGQPEEIPDTIHVVTECHPENQGREDVNPGVTPQGAPSVHLQVTDSMPSQGNNHRRIGDTCRNCQRQPNSHPHHTTLCDERQFSEINLSVQNVGPISSRTYLPKRPEKDIASTPSQRHLDREDNSVQGKQSDQSSQIGQCPTYDPLMKAYPYTSHLLPGHATTALPMLHDSEAPPAYHHDDDVENQHPDRSNPETQCSIHEISHIGQSVVQTANHPSPRPTDKLHSYSIITAYILCLLLGFLGIHHMYLGRRKMALVYACSFGLFGVGWLLDLLRLSSLVADINRNDLENRSRGFILHASPYGELREMSMMEAFIWWLPPSGLFGGLHYALGRRKLFAGIHAATFGFFGLGWFADLFRLRSLTRRRNIEVQRFIDGEAIPDNPGEEVNLEDAYLLCALLGFLGVHHAYLRQPLLFVLYFFTFGLVGIGWVADLVRMSNMVTRRKTELRQGINPLHLDNAYLLLCTFGFLGFHHFYLRRIGTGFIYLLTGGVLGFGCYYDHYRISELVKEANAERRLSPDQNVSRRHLVPFRVPLDSAGCPDWEGRTAWLSDPVQARRYRIQHAFETAADVTRMQIGARTRDEDLMTVFVPPEEELPSLPPPPQIHDNHNPPPSYREHLFHDRLPTETIILNPDMANI